MRTLLLALALGCIYFNLSAQDKGLTGKWQTPMRGNRIVTLEIGKDSTFTLINGKDTLGGRKFLFGTGDATTSFSVDTASMPAGIDVHVIDLSSGKPIFTFQGIYELRKGGLLLRVRRDASDRPRSFTPKGNDETFFFTRI